MTGSIDVFGSVGILNVGQGDTKLSFDPANPAERIRAARIVADMLRRGYALLVEVERDGVKKFERALSFREDTCEYIIAEFDPVTAEKADKEEAEHVDEPVAPAAASEGEAGAKAQKGGRRGRKRAVDAGSTRAVAVARSAGG